MAKTEFDKLWWDRDFIQESLRSQVKYMMSRSPTRWEGDTPIFEGRDAEVWKSAQYVRQRLIIQLQKINQLE